MLVPWCVIAVRAGNDTPLPHAMQDSPCIRPGCDVFRADISLDTVVRWTKQVERSAEFAGPETDEVGRRHGALRYLL